MSTNTRFLTLPSSLIFCMRPIREMVPELKPPLSHSKPDGSKALVDAAVDLFRRRVQEVIEAGPTSCSAAFGTRSLHGSPRPRTPAPSACAPRSPSMPALRPSPAHSPHCHHIGLGDPQRLRVVLDESVPGPADVHADAGDHVELRHGNVRVAHATKEEVILLLLALFLGHHVRPRDHVFRDVPDLPCPFRGPRRGLFGAGCWCSGLLASDPIPLQLAHLALFGLKLISPELQLQVLLEGLDHQACIALRQGFGMLRCCLALAKQRQLGHEHLPESSSKPCRRPDHLAGFNHRYLPSMKLHVLKRASWA